MKKLAQTGGEGQTPASIAQTAQQNNKLEPDAVNKKIDYTMDASIKSKMNKIMSGDAAGQNQKDNPFTLGADRGQDVDIRNIVNATSYYKTMKDNYNKGSVGGDAGLQQAKKDANKQVPTLSQLQKKGGLQPWQHLPNTKMPAPPEGNSQGQKIPPQKPKGKFMNKKAARRHEMGIGSVVKDINPTCPHKGARGEVVKSYPDKVTFIVDNEGPTYSPGDKLTKTIEQMRKTAGSKLKAVKHILRAAGHISRGKALSTGKKYVYNRKIPPNKGYSAQGIPPENSRRALRLHNIEGIERTKVSPGWTEKYEFAAFPRDNQWDQIQRYATGTDNLRSHPYSIRNLLDKIE